MQSFTITWRYTRVPCFWPWKMWGDSMNFRPGTLAPYMVCTSNLDSWNGSWNKQQRTTRLWWRFGGEPNTFSDSGHGSIGNVWISLDLTAQNGKKWGQWRGMHGAPGHPFPRSCRTVATWIDDHPRSYGLIMVDQNSESTPRFWFYSWSYVCMTNVWCCRSHHTPNLT